MTKNFRFIILMICLVSFFLIVNSSLSQPAYRSAGKITDTAEFRFTFDIPREYNLFIQYRLQGATEWKYVKEISLVLTQTDPVKIYEGNATPQQVGITESGTYEFRIIGFENDIEECAETPNTCIESNYLVLTVKVAEEIIKEANEKDLSKYTDKTVFLISDRNWRDVLSLVPVAVWTNEDGSVTKHPLLIYHREGNAFDADSIIYFMQQYNPDKVVIVGKSPKELDNLLIVKPELGAGLDDSQILRIYPQDYSSYWGSVAEAVAVDYDNYEAGLMASTFASYINGPVLFLNSENLNNYKQLINGRKVYVIGSVDSAVSDYVDSNAREVVSYSLSELQKEYVKLTNTDKIILVNSNDLNIKVVEEFTPEKSANSISELYSKSSLTAPILASAKYELIITTPTKTYDVVDKIIEDKIEELTTNINYLTIFASPLAVQQAKKPLEGRPNVKDMERFEEIDNHIYGDLDGDYFQELAVGRIFGITIADASSYVARDLFYEEISHSKNFAALWAPNFYSMYAEGKTIDKILSAAGFNEQSVYTGAEGEPELFNPKVDFENKFFIAYLDHGWWGGGSNGFDTANLKKDNIWFSPSIIIMEACSTCSFDITNNPDLFCINTLRRGALGFIGAVEISGTPAEPPKIILEQLLLGKDFGSALKHFKHLIIPDPINWKYGPYYILLGDPTFNFHLNYPSSLSRVKVETNVAEEYFKIYLPSLEKSFDVNIPTFLGDASGKMFEGQLGEYVVSSLFRDLHIDPGKKDSNREPYNLKTGNIVLVILLENLKINKIIKVSNGHESDPCREIRDKFCVVDIEDSIWIAYMIDNKNNHWVHISINLKQSELDKDVIPSKEFIIHYE